MNAILGLLSKGDIKVNHFIRNEPAHARASVVVFSAGARVLDRIPTEPGEVQDLVNKGAGK